MHTAGPLLAAALIALTVVGCGGEPAPPAEVVAMGSAACWEVAEHPAPDAAVDLGVELDVELVSSAFANPLLVLPDPAGRTLVVELAGRIRDLDDPDHVVLDLVGRVGTANEQGLLGAAFSPDGDRMWIHYTEADSNDTVVAEYTYADGTATEEVELLRLPQTVEAHNGGSLVVGPDGYLYLALGDSGVSENGQDPSNPYGAILRFDACTPGELVAAAGNPGAADDRVWHYGLRNPYRIWFGDGLLYIADVGRMEAEEVNVVPADRGGLNFGWPAFEGESCHYGPCDLEGLVDPTIVHARQEGELCALIGGEVYRGTAIPELTGRYVYGDFCAQRLWTVLMDGTELVDHRDFEVEYEGRLLGFGHDADGELYFGTNAGRVYRITTG